MTDVRGAAKGAVPEPGEQVGRFRIIEVLGKGGMGVVLAAHDPELQRRVALKLVRAGGAGTGEREENQNRLLREAQALARLRHPNVVSVHEAGTHDGRVYVAMDLIPGGTLRDELARMRTDEAPDWRRVLGLFSKAGRGLAAAHACGLVHRDFKPDNVFVDGDHVVVGDFGLVAASGATSTPSPGLESIDEPLTRADEVIGTPAYMAPEQQVRATIDARTDQFAFCVSLYEALYGEPPFPGNTRADYFAAMTASEFRPAPPGSDVPAWLRAVVRRGLSPDPADRYPSMESLLDEFDLEVLRPSWRARIVGGSVVLLGFLGITFAPDLVPASAGYAAGFAAHAAALLAVLVTSFGLRQTVLRTTQNRRVVGVFLLALAPGLLFLGGAALMNLELTHARAALPLTWAIVGYAAAIFLDYRGWIAGGAYTVAFFVGAARPQWAPAAASIAHALLFLNLLLLRRDIVRG